MRESDRAYNEIVNLLLGGELRCGQPVDDGRLQQMLSVGKTPLREALLRLTSDGFITSVPHSGMYVANFNVAQLEAMLRIRTLLAGYLGKELVQNASLEDIERVEADMRRSICMGERAPLGLTAQTDFKFHAALGTLSGNTILAGLLQKLEIMSNMALMPYAREYYKNEESIKQEYFGILEQLKARNEEGLEIALKKHIPQYVLKHE